MYYGENASINSKHNDNWRKVLEIGTKIDVYDTPYKKWFKSTVIEINVDTNEVKISYDGYSAKFDVWLNRDSDRIAKYCTHTGFYMGKWISTKSRPKTSGNGNDFPICRGSGGGGGNRNGECGGNGGGILQIIANNIIIHKNGGIYSNGEKGVETAGSGSGGSIHIKCNNLMNKGSITAISLNNYFMNIIHIKIYVNKYINIEFPNELCDIIKKFISNVDGSGKIFIDCSNEYNKTGIFPKKFL